MGETIVCQSHAKEIYHVSIHSKNNLFRTTHDKKKKKKGILSLSRNENLGIMLVDRQKDIWSLREYEFE